MGDLKGAILSRERMAPFVRSPARRRGIRSSAGALKFQMLKPLSLHNVLTTAKIMTAPRLAVVLSWSNRGEISQISNPRTLRVRSTCLMSGSTISGSRPSYCGALTPGANADEKTSEQTVMYVSSHW